MTFTTAISPYIRHELSEAEALMAREKPQEAFVHLENAHVLGQKSTRWHVLAHVRMLQWAVRNRDLREFLGQLLRIIGAATKTAIGLVPTGNTGGSNVSPFRPMPLNDEHKTILERITDRDTGSHDQHA